MIAGLEAYGSNYIAKVFDPEFLNLTADLEKAGQALFPGNLSREQYIEKNAISSILFLIDVQKWKNRYFGKHRDFLQLDTPEKIAGTFHDFFHAGSDWEKIQLLCSLTKLGQTYTQNCLKKATMIAQFLDSFAWGMMDWRTVGILGLPGVIDLKKEPAAIKAPLCFEPVNEAVLQRAIKILRSCRSPDLPRAMDVGLSVYFASLDLWSAETTTRLERRQN